MKVVVAGGGPAGLCLGMLLKQRRRSDEVQVFERAAAGETYGWGITLPRRMMARLEAVDPAAARALISHSAAWDQIQIFHRGRRVEISGSPLLGISRVTLLQILQQRCEALGVHVSFGTSIDPAALPECDLLVIADGATSTLRAFFPDDFGTTSRAGRNRYTWLGTSRVFAGLTLGFATNADGLFIAHAYPFSDGASTFIVECGADTWQTSGLGEQSSEDASEYLARVFEDCLDGHPLLFRRSVKWASFNHITNERWQRDQMVLIGDAAHAVHFSVGSGTMLAIEDAIVLVEKLGTCDPVSAALREFELARKPALEGFRALEDTTVARLERMDRFVDLEPLEMAYFLLSR